MKDNQFFLKTVFSASIFILALIPLYSQQQDAVESSEPVTVFRGEVLGADSGDELVYATLAIEGTNVATVTNAEGEFSLRIPVNLEERNLTISYIGYETKVIAVADLDREFNEIELIRSAVSLDKISVFPSDPELLMYAVMGRRDENYAGFNSINRAFYRETIRKGLFYVSLTEAVIDVYRFPYHNMRSDRVKLLAGRRSTDYDRIDTLAFRLQGGPQSAFMLDVMKDPYTLFDSEIIEHYNFEMEDVTVIDDRLLYVVSFKQKSNVEIPLFYGRVYVDTQNLAIARAVYNMNVEDRDEAARMFVRSKPFGARVYPTEASYEATYREQEDGLWYLAHTKGNISFRINWRRRLFNTNYHTSIEMAVTDWEKTEERPFRGGDRLRMNVIMEDEVLGFLDEDFWGDYNVIEPEAPIERLIRRIGRRLD
ncbi:carboxypeptidase-like regulatory domain-containing protein [Marinilabiliaceae bacterium ANBcel2]|nr:carboxypeptidase-like regulatory domain-containing protein [Marinilabiliaceae bacterium ANBcel2]